mmetsp:Transcript_12509/g.32287  ORF Transcript_12509/g.32287 Transcript_12509/m.32287 type:complete len:295 (-) Transcript_12509:564-1448(-)
MARWVTNQLPSDTSRMKTTSEASSLKPACRKRIVCAQLSSISVLVIVISALPRLSMLKVGSGLSLYSHREGICSSSSSPSSHPAFSLSRNMHRGSVYREHSWEGGQGCSLAKTLPKPERPGLQRMALPAAFCRPEATVASKGSPYLAGDRSAWKHLPLIPPAKNSIETRPTRKERKRHSATTDARGRAPLSSVWATGRMPGSRVPTWRGRRTRTRRTKARLGAPGRNWSHATATMINSNMVHPSRRYEWGCSAKPKATTFAAISAVNTSVMAQFVRERRVSRSRVSSSSHSVRG